MHKIFLLSFWMSPNSTKIFLGMIVHHLNTIPNWNFNKLFFFLNWFWVCHNLYHSKGNGFMSMFFSSIMDVWACFFHLSWIYERVVFIYHGFMSMLFSSIVDLWACCFHLLWIYEHVFMYHFLSTHSQDRFAYVTNCTVRKINK
jgi:hypothetical protein